MLVYGKRQFRFLLRWLDQVTRRAFHEVDLSKRLDTLKTDGWVTVDIRDSPKTGIHKSLVALVPDLSFTVRSRIAQARQTIHPSPPSNHMRYILEQARDASGARPGYGNGYEGFRLDTAESSREWTGDARAALFALNARAFENAIRKPDFYDGYYDPPDDDIAQALLGMVFGDVVIGDSLPPEIAATPIAFHYDRERMLLDFLQGRPIRDRLERMIGDMDRFAGEQRGHLDDLALFLGALCVWTGRQDLLKNLSMKARPYCFPEIATLLNGFAAIFERDWTTADKLLVHFADPPRHDRGFAYVNRDWPDSRFRVPGVILAILIILRRKFVATRLAKLTGILMSFQRYAAEDNPLSPGYELLSLCSEAAMCATTHASRDIGFMNFTPPRTLPGSILRTYVFMASPGVSDEPEATKTGTALLDAAERAAAAGYPMAAAIIAGCIAGTSKIDARARTLLASYTKAGGVAFWEAEAPAPFWTHALEFLAGLFPAGETSDQAKADPREGVISWRIQLFQVFGSSLWQCRRIRAFYQKTLRNGRAGTPRGISLKAIAAGKYDFALTDQDIPIKLRISRNAGEYYFDDGGYVLPLSTLKLLCGHPRVYITLADASTDWYEKWDGLRFIPIRLEAGELAVRAEQTRGKGLAISLPWMSDAIPETGYFERVDDATFRFYAVNAAARKLDDVIRRYGERGVLTIPAEGLETAAPVLKALAAHIPLQGSFAGQSAAAAFETVAGNTALHVRLVFKANVLEMSFRVKPLAGDEHVCAPGVGLAERTLQTGGKTILLKRDLKAETEAAGKALAALPDLSGWDDGNGVWRIDSLPDALAALAALKALPDGMVTLEWPEGESLTVSSVARGGARMEAFESAEKWFSVRGTFTLDSGKVLSFIDLLEHLGERHGKFIRLDDAHYLALTAAMTKRLEALESAGTVKGGKLEIPPAAVPMLEGVFAGPAEDAWALPELITKRMAEFRAAFARKFEVPTRFKCELRPYQLEGYVWLSRLAACGLGACLADDMGLGKTIEVMALLLARADDGPSLVVAPASVCGNWQKEIFRFAPTLRVFVAGQDDAAIPDGGPGPHDIVVASYGLLVSREETFTATVWNGVVLDEAQAIKNQAAKRAKSVKALRAKFRIVATGTPIENRLGELWSLFDFLNPGLLGPSSTFLERFSKDGQPTAALKRLVAPIILRRIKRDVLDDLPEKTEITLPVILGDEERHAYEGCRIHALEKLSGEAGENRISILAELTRLRRFCCNPSLVLPEFKESAKLDALADLLEGLRENGHRALVFSQFVDFLSIVRKLLEARGWSYQYLDGATPTAERTRRVDTFQKGEGDFFLISLKAGGMGLNLTAANYVILLDPWWNPAVENQAADRAHRIGQTQPVTVYRLIAVDTVEERVMDLHKRKLALAEDVLEGTGSSVLTTDMLKGLFDR